MPSIVFGCAGMMYDDSTPENSPLGGSESALVYLSRELVKLGADVRIYNRCPNPGTYSGVEYRRWEELVILPQYDVDFFVCIRDPKIATVWKAGGHKILWCQDWYDQPVFSGLQPGMIEDIFFVGGWQLDDFCSKMGWNPNKAWVLPNGVVSEYYDAEDPRNRDKRMFYSSTPFRGLKHLVDIYPRIKEQVPDAELHLYGGMGVYQDWNNEYDSVYSNFFDIDGVTIHGPLGQRKLAEEMQKSRILAYPNTFPESSCITAFEAMAAGNVVVTSHHAGLIDTVGYNGMLIGGKPGDQEYDARFVDICVDLLRNDHQWKHYAIRARDHTLNNCTWAHRAVTWMENFDLIMRGG